MAAISAHPQLVGNAFVSQYYNVLHQSPHVVHRFYTDASSLTRAEAGPEGLVETVYSQSGIHEKVMSMDYGGLRAEIKTVDCQDSYTGSVLVMVTGSLSSKSNGKRDFVQTFFLAPQEKGYFVLNDIFRYLDEPQVSKSPYAMPNGAQERTSIPDSVVDPPYSGHMKVRESTPPVAEVDVLVDEVYEIPEQEDTEDEVVIEEIAQDGVPLEVGEVPSTKDPGPHEEAQGEQPKKSYASILRVMRDAAGSHQSIPNAIQKTSSAVAEKPDIHSPQTAPVPAPAPPLPMDALEEAAPPTETEVEGRSIYIKNLPMTITASELEEELQKFGAVKSGCTNVKKQQNVCYAFLEFEESSSAHAAVQASPIQINGKIVYIEEKRPIGSRGAYRGRGRGRNEGTRGRGYFQSRGGGRNYEVANRDRGRGSRGAYTNTSNAGGQPFANSNGEAYHRYEGQNGNGPARPRRGQFSRNGSFVARNVAAAAPAAVTAA